MYTVCARLRPISTTELFDSVRKAATTFLYDESYPYFTFNVLRFSLTYNDNETVLQRLRVRRHKYDTALHNDKEAVATITTHYSHNSLSQKLPYSLNASLYIGSEEATLSGYADDPARS
jgi:hypothetical protein